jgi:putative DNA primase/helicase
MVLSTGEKGLAEKIAEEGGRVQAGQAVRLIDVPADAGAGLGLFENLHGHASAQAFADAIKSAASTHYGHAARAFIATFQQNRAEAADTLHKGFATGLECLCLPDVDGQVQRVARRFLLCALAGEMAAEWGLLPWGQGEALAAVKTCFDAWLARRGGVGAAEDAAIVEQVTLFLEQHGASRFQDVGNQDAVCINRVGFRRNREDGATVYYVLPESFKEICKGHDVTRAARVLRDAGLLIPDGKHFKGNSPNLPGLGRQKCYILKASAGGEEHETP